MYAGIANRCASCICAAEYTHVFSILDISAIVNDSMTEHAHFLRDAYIRVCINAHTCTHMYITLILSV